VSTHGTHVAGTIGGVGGNGIGVAGVNWAVTMISAKFLENSGDTSDAVAALDYLTDLRVRHGLNIVATNDSWGGTEFDQALLDAINRGGDAGILFIGAAGLGLHRVGRRDRCERRARRLLELRREVGRHRRAR
jgi:thermitase